MKTLLSTTFMAIVLVVAPFSATADDSKIDVGSNNALEKALVKLVGKNVTLQLGGDEPITGTVDSVGTDAVLISQLTGKEFFSAVVKIDDVSAVIYRAK